MRPEPAPAQLGKLDLFRAWTEAAALDGRLDPFDVYGRMAAYRALVTSINLTRAFGEDNADNPLWGLMFQLQWQWRSGRLNADPEAGRAIDPDAPWGYGNYTLSVVPYLGAVAAGVVADVEILLPTQACRFNYISGKRANRQIPAELRAPIQDWQDFFGAAAALNPGDDLETLRVTMWKAHKTSLDVVAAKLEEIGPRLYSATELAFLRGWCRMVDYLWAAAWPTDFQFMVDHGLDGLPERILGDADADRKLEDVPKQARNNARNVMGLGQTPAWRHGFNLWMWRRVMRTRKARGEVQALLDALFNPRPENKAQRGQLLRYLLAV